MLTGTAIATGAILAVALATPAGAATSVSSTTSTPGWASGDARLQRAVKVQNVVKHLEAFQAAADANGGNRAAGTAGHEAAATYIERQLKRVGYKVTRQPFSYDNILVESSAFQQTAPTAATYGEDDYIPFSYTGEGDVTAPATAVDVNLTGDRASTSGCEAADFAAFPVGNIALIQRGSCDFVVKAANAAAAGAGAVVVFNQGNDVPGDDRFGVINGTLGEPGTIPVFGTTFDLGAELVGTAGVTLRLQVDTTTQTVNTFNVIADTRWGSPNHKVVVGAHLDSVPEGPGINDNGSGSAAILETAIQLAKTLNITKNQVRFAWWSGEEDGLIGSDYYVSQLTEADIAKHDVNLNFDMVASPNPVSFVYDGDGDAFGEAGPEGSAGIEETFEQFFASKGLPTAPTAFDGRSDYYGFINAGIPAGGLFTGAEGIKTADEAALFGGTAGEPYDPCYHSACDDISNLDTGILDVMSDAIAHTTLKYGGTYTWKDIKGWGGWKPLFEKFSNWRHGHQLG